MCVVLWWIQTSVTCPKRNVRPTTSCWLLAISTMRSRNQCTRTTRSKAGMDVVCLLSVELDLSAGLFGHLSKERTACFPSEKCPLFVDAVSDQVCSSWGIVFCPLDCCVHHLSSFVLPPCLTSSPGSKRGVCLWAGSFRSFVLPISSQNVTIVGGPCLISPF